MLNFPAGSPIDFRAPPSASFSRAQLRRSLDRAGHRPLVLVCSGFIAGDCAASTQPSHILLGLAALAIVAALIFLAAASKARHAVLCTVSALLVLGFGLGAARAMVTSIQQSDNLLAAAARRGNSSQAAVLTGVVASPERQSPRGEWVVIDVLRFTLAGTNQSRAVPAASKALILLPHEPDAALSRIDVGDSIRAQGILSSAAERSPTQLDAGWTEWLNAQGISAELKVRPVDGAVCLGSPSLPSLPELASRVADDLRLRCDQQLRFALSAPDAAVAGGILLGERSELSPGQLSEFAAAGCAHLLATAGLHVGILVLMLQGFLNLLTAPRKLAAALIICAVWLYAFAAGDRAAVARAACVATLYYGAILLERAPEMLSALALCALGMLWIEPPILRDSGFQLSFCTVLGLIFVMPALTPGAESWTSKLQPRALRRIARGALEVELLAVAAQAVSAPLVALNYNQVSCLGVFANLAACPLMFLLLPAAFVSFCLGSVWPPLGVFCLRAAMQPVLHALLACVGWFASKPGCAVAAASPSAPAIALYYVILYTACRLLPQRKTHESHRSNARPGRLASPAAGASAAAAVGNDRSASGPQLP